MLTQKQIEYQRKMIELQIKRCKVPHGFINMNPAFAEELLDMAETLLAIQWADRWNASRNSGDCHSCPLSVWDGCNRECQSVYAYRNEWKAAYRERGNK